MKRLRENSECWLFVEGLWTDCSVVGVHEGQAILQPRSVRRVYTLPDISYGAELSFEDRDRKMVMLVGACVADRRRRELRFVVTDGVQLREPRRALRVPVRLEVRAAALGDGGAPAGEWVPTTTVELSATGMTLECAPGLDEVGAYVVDVAVPDDEEAPVRATFDVKRRSDQGLHGPLRMSPEGALRLEVFLLDHRRTRVRSAGRQSAEVEAG